MSTRECWLLGSRVHTSMMPVPGAQVLMAWHNMPGFAPVLLAKKRFDVTDTAGLTVRNATEADMPAIRGLYAMTGGKAQLLPVREGMWTAEGAQVAVNADGRVVAYSQGGEMRDMWNLYEWGIDPETDTAAAASAFAKHAGFGAYQLRAEFCPAGGTVTSGECVYIGVPKPFLLGTQMITSAKQLAEMIEETQKG